MPAPLNPGRGHGAIGPQGPQLPWNQKLVPFGRKPYGWIFSNPRLTRVSQEALETVYQTPSAQARVSQEALEVVSSPPPGPFGNRISQEAIEAVTSPPKGNLVSQDAIEVEYTSSGALNRLSQEALELLYELGGAANRVSQEAIEVLLLGGAPTPTSTKATNLYLGHYHASTSMRRLIAVSTPIKASKTSPVGTFVSQEAVEVLTNLF